MNEEKKSKNVWGIVLKVIITVATAIAGALGLGACTVAAHRKKSERIASIITDTPSVSVMKEVWMPTVSHPTLAP